MQLSRQPRSVRAGCSQRVPAAPGILRLQRPASRWVAKAADSDSDQPATAPETTPSPVSSSHSSSFTPSAASTSAPAAATAVAPSPAAPTARAATVAELDALRFKLDPSVERWSTRDTILIAAISDPKDDKKASNPAASAYRLVEVLPRLLPAGGPAAAVSDPARAAHWAYHLVRHLSFNGLAVAGFAAHDLVERLQRLQRQLAGGSSGSSGRGSSSRTRTPFEKLLESAEAEFAYRLSDFIEAVDQDYDNIKSGAYPLPWDMTSPSHRQYSPAYVAASSAAYVGEWIKMTQRRLDKQPEKLWLDGGKLYPQYYTKTFHFQTDGWFSARSAFVYETNTEALFSGLQDIMQRTALLPIADYVREAGSGSGPASSASGASERSPAQLRLLEVAAGTGRFHTFIKDAYPDMRTVCSDLSPFYLARARNNLRYWRRLRAPGRSLGGVDETGTEFLQTAAEDIAAPDESFDIVVCVYLFHELPEAVRRRAVAEFARVLRPGGLLVLTDSVQLGDRPGLERNLDVFGDFNEPYYRNYLSCDLGAMGEEAGLVPDGKWVSLVTKTLSFRKPWAGEALATAPAVDSLTA
ncbi:hypothetical protein HYH02_007312 [Chlamydomonas schloesseri]|uniref:Methyltransferase type 11 domain-containing protein n=1 Tax=Chlamydomonas schloesseri TaxID=2026947 RepID=A0A835WIP3_9CHLO|nr:hypothetical protein HYH02_007312 [Chlamydomonas schloesseri]|eukprot:KAG2447856.1 hypothetical protein HYH02_007312 [Chlamydomonas schloesseri]